MVTEPGRKNRPPYFLVLVLILITSFFSIAIQNRNLELETYGAESVDTSLRILSWVEHLTDTPKLLNSIRFVILVTNRCISRIIVYLQWIYNGWYRR